MVSSCLTSSGVNFLAEYCFLPSFLASKHSTAFFLQRASISAPVIDMPMQMVLQKLPSQTKIILRLAFPMLSRKSLIFCACRVNIVDKLWVIFAWIYSFFSCSEAFFPGFLMGGASTKLIGIALHG